MIWAALIAVAVLLCVAGARFTRALKQFEGGLEEARYRVDVSDTGLSLTDPRGETRAIAWSEVSRVVVLTTSEGPFAPDVFWCFHIADADTPELMLPSGAEGADGMLEALQSVLPDFDNEALIDAMGSTDDTAFEVWSAGRDSPTEPDGSTGPDGSTAPDGSTEPDSSNVPHSSTREDA